MDSKIISVQKEMNNLLKNKIILVACSTGVDSTVLLDLARKVPHLKKIIVAHVNHQKRLQSEIEEQYIRGFCQEKQLACYVLRLEKHHGGNFQEWARNRRYQFFKEIIEKEHVEILLTAHHADDNLETILMRLIKGSSIKGYAGIAKITDEDQYQIYRPLIKISKKEIIEYADSQHLQYYTDESNSSDDYTRNRIRKYLVPVMNNENPALYDSITDFSETLFEMSEMLEKSINIFIKEHVVTNNNSINFEINSFLQQTSFFQIQLLFSLLKPYSLSTTCIKEIIKKIASSKEKIVSSVSKDLMLIKEYGQVVLLSKDTLPQSFYLKIESDGEYDLPQNLTISVNKKNCYLKTINSQVCYNIPRLPIIIRSRKDGDRLHFSHGTKTVSDYLTDQKLSQIERMKILLVCDENNQPLFILK